MRPSRLNVGCGFDVRPDYLNVDFQPWHKPNILADVRQLPLTESSFDEVLAQDVLEHLPRTATVATLQEWVRVLAPGGRLYLRVPDVLGVADWLRHPDKATIEHQEQLIQCLYGTQAYTGDWHQTAFTPKLLTHYLVTVGLAVESMEHKDGWLLDVVAVKKT